MRLFLFFALFVLVVPAFSQQRWERRYGSERYDEWGFLFSRPLMAVILLRDIVMVIFNQLPDGYLIKPSL